MAFLVVLESLTPAQRVALILHDIFGYPFAEVAGITGRTPAACPARSTAPSGSRAPASLSPARHLAFQIVGAQITRIWTIFNPGKLRPWAATG